MDRRNPSPEELFTRLAPEFEEDCADFGREFSRYCFTLRHVAPLVPPGASVLDIGAGPGVMSIALAELGAQVTVGDKWEHYRPGDEAAGAASDPTRSGLLPRMHERFARHGVSVRDLDLVTDRFPFPDASFDVVLFLAVIEHLPKSPRRVLEEVRRVLKPGGVLVLEVPNIAALRNRLKLLLGRSVHFPLEDWYYSDPFCGHYRELTRSEVARYFQFAGLETVWIRTSNTSFHNTKLASGYYQRGFRLNSLFQWAKGVYLLLCLPVPGWRFQILAAGRKPRSSPGG